MAYPVSTLNLFVAVDVCIVEGPSTTELFEHWSIIFYPFKSNLVVSTIQMTPNGGNWGGKMQVYVCREYKTSPLHLDIFSFIHFPIYIGIKLLPC